MNILQDLPHKIEYIEPKNYLNEFIFTDTYDDFNKGMMKFLNKFIDVNEKGIFEYDKENMILKSEFRDFIRYIKKKSRESN